MEKINTDYKPFHPIRSKNETIHAFFASVFPARCVSSMNLHLLWVLSGSLDCLCSLWLRDFIARVINFVLVLRHSIENRSLCIHQKERTKERKKEKKRKKIGVWAMFLMYANQVPSRVCYMYLWNCYMISHFRIMYFSIFNFSVAFLEQHSGFSIPLS